MGSQVGFFIRAKIDGRFKQVSGQLVSRTAAECYLNLYQRQFPRAEAEIVEHRLPQTAEQGAA
jgi:hypothetical protein